MLTLKGRIQELRKSERGARSYNACLGAETFSGVHGKTTVNGSGQSPPETESFLTFECHVERAKLPSPYFAMQPY